ncbi:DUF4333 domain-containing protein [Mycobacterium sp. CBMA293]|nr:DUF4333 domain-containing protein [Mycolicibacterium sp. CBMA 360]MUL59158.1 DUF4333 domain-containing protein [Mycolicibacterium sp. CBMA 335]MUL69552.1 DUF4333 domain-containing protein [Mycolicibacterium sp. CBMA 311]MUL94516.1 DUF4333 domain-containing protein [Mycolicibacterium sp. CBMA 230]MUM06467.1 hypothetical protein [Mycolicibacterium sp. CBMA 213]MUM11645.1 DUF4333 domain-containing protein [Mycolicibacterium sp. CBMA 293]MUM30773.1 DUF4333 domain-containing protein [Mycoliciba
MVLRSTMRRIATLAAAGLVAACSFKVGVEPPSPIPKDKLAAAVKDQLSSKTKATIDSVVCDGDLEPTVGATQTCTVVTGATTRHALVRTAAIRGTDIGFNVEIVPGQ